MANIKSQKKRNLTNEKARVRNVNYKSRVRTAIKGVRLAVEKNDKALATTKLNLAISFSVSVHFLRTTLVSALLYMLIRPYAYPEQTPLPFSTMLNPRFYATVTFYLLYTYHIVLHDRKWLSMHCEHFL